MRAKEMSKYGRLVWKLAAINDLFELRDLGDRLRETTEFGYSDVALSNYLRGRKPPEGFSDQLRRALNLSPDLYYLLLETQDRATGDLSPTQRKEKEKLERVVFIKTLGRSDLEGRTRDTVSMDIKTRAGGRIRQARLARGINPTDLSRRAGVTRQTIYSVESGQYVSLDMLAKLAEALDVPLADLLAD
jgi:DNA-binding XRE family transcriptional regulator